MLQIHPSKQGLNPWIARKNAFVRKVEIVSKHYHSQRGRNPTNLVLWEQLIDDTEVRAQLKVETFIRLEQEVNSFWFSL